MTYAILSLVLYLLAYKTFAHRGDDSSCQTGEIRTSIAPPKEPRVRR